MTDPAEDSLGLPSGYGQYDIPLILGSKFYNKDGSLRSALQEEHSLWGDIIHVNGQPWPLMNVQPRKYRFRFLNAALSRNFALYFAKSTNVGTKLPFKVIASDAGLLEVPVQTSDLFVSVAERYEIVFDFSSYRGQTLELRNLKKAGGIGVDVDYLHTDKVMRFVVSNNAVGDSSVVPSSLRQVPFPPSSSGTDHTFRFERNNGEWLINGVGFTDAGSRVLAKVPRGTVEIWQLENNSGGWTHPVHVHLVDFKILQRTGGNRGVMPYEARGLKDVVWLAKNEKVLVEAHYAPWNGVYMFHCHNLIHEDHDMMAAFNVTALAEFGYKETTDFSDPMDPSWRARSYSRNDFLSRTGAFSSSSITQRVQELARQQPYSELDKVEKALDDYWKANGDGNPNSPRDTGAPPTGNSDTPIPRYRRFIA